MRQQNPLIAFLGASLVALGGCGSGNTVWVTGNLLKGGSQYVPPTGQLVYVTFVAMDVKDEPGAKVSLAGEPFVAQLDQATGTFSVPGKEGKGIPPGRYRIAITQKMTRETFDATNPQPKKGAKRADRETDTLGGQFGLDNSPIVREVSASSRLTIDLDRPTENSH
jgi:hypothetical protein